MQLPTLYSRTSTGKVQQWTVEIEQDKFRTISGQTDGAKITSEWTVCKGKNVGRANETSPAQQAEAEAAAKHKKKLESGYRLSVTDIDTADFVEPMLAKNYDDYKDRIKFPVFTQPKLDGIRCVVSKDGMFTRNGKRITAAPHIFDAVKFMFNRYPTLVLDGELYADKLKNDFNKIVSLAKKVKPTVDELEESRKTLQYWIYDIVNINWPFSKRTRAVQGVVSEVSASFIVDVETRLAQTPSALDALYEKWVASGMEGQMIRLDEPYEHKRSKTLLKRKEFQDTEFEIIDVQEGTGNRSGMAGNVILRMKGDHSCGHTGMVYCEICSSSCNIMGGMEFYRRLLNEKDLVLGKLGTVKFFNMTPDGFPRFPYLKTIRDYE